MSAGTIVISGGILAGVILLCIVAVLCYCRLQVRHCPLRFHSSSFFFFLDEMGLDLLTECIEKGGLRIYKSL